MPDIAVITPTYNRATLIPAALDSVLAQTVLRHGRSIEVAVVDDGSTDGTAGVMQRYVAATAPGGGASGGGVVIRYHRLEKQGVVAARNLAIAQTRAPYIAFLDSDDSWDPRKLERQLALMEFDPRVGVVHTSFRYVDEAGAFKDEGPQRLDNPCVGACLDVLLREFLVVFSSVLIRRAVVDQAAQAEPHGQPFDARWTNAQDYDLILRAARFCRFAYVPEALTLYRLHGAHGAMGNLKRAYGFHSQVQLDFVRRYGAEVGVDEAEARRRAAAFILGRAQAAFWRRQLGVVRDLCDLAGEMGFSNAEFARLHRRAARPGAAWVYRIKDALDHWRRRGAAR
jgi:glycosyltransferase involved in cell wall biosynthesis